MDVIRGWLSASHIDWLIWAESLLVLLLFWLAGFSFRTILFRYLTRLCAKTETRLDDILIEASRLHVLIWAFLLGIFFAAKVAPLDQQTTLIVHKVLSSVFLLSVTFLLAGISAELMKNYGRRASLSMPLTSLTENLLRIVIVILGVLLLLSNLGVSITPLLTALGVGSLAVALALQDTLSNLFAGFIIIANKQIKPGDYIKMDSGQEGFVIDIGWRSTRLRELSNNIILVPNAKIGTSIVTNYHLHDQQVGITVPCGVAYGSDLAMVERVATEVARSVMQDVPGAVKDFQPFIRYTSFGDSAIQFNIILRVMDFVDQYLVIHELIKRLHARFAAEHIDIPFPQHVVHIAREEHLPS
jgi:small-conductance mechanosensitive channel